MVDAQQLRSAAHGDNCGARFLEVGVISRGPEHGGDRNPARLLQLVGQSQRAQRLRQSIKRTSKEARLLASRDDHATTVCRCFEARLRFSGRFERWSQPGKPIAWRVLPYRINALA